MKNIGMTILSIAVMGFGAAPARASIDPTTQKEIETLVARSMDPSAATKGVDSSQDPKPAIKRHIDQIYTGPLADEQFKMQVAAFGTDTSVQYEISRIQLEQDAKGILAYV